MRAVVAISSHGALAVSNAEPAGHLVQIDVSAVDARGQAVLDTQTGRFQLREEGAPSRGRRAIASAEEPRARRRVSRRYHVDAGATARVREAVRAISSIRTSHRPISSW